MQGQLCHSFQPAAPTCTDLLSASRKLGLVLSRWSPVCRKRVGPKLPAPAAYSIHDQRPRIALFVTHQSSKLAPQALPARRRSCVQTARTENQHEHGRARDLSSPIGGCSTLRTLHLYLEPQNIILRHTGSGKDLPAVPGSMT